MKQKKRNKKIIVFKIYYYIIEREKEGENKRNITFFNHTHTLNSHVSLQMKTTKNDGKKYI